MHGDELSPGIRKIRDVYKRQMELLAYILNFFDCDTNVTIVTDIATKLISVSYTHLFSTVSVSILKKIISEQGIL